MARTSRIAWILITSMMLTSLFAGMDWEEKSLEEFDEMQTTGRADYELKLHDVLQPRETFVDAAGNTQNAIDIGDVVYFRPIIINEGDNAANEFNIRVTVTPAGDGQQPVIDNLDDAVCPGNTAVTGCSFNTLPSGNFLGGYHGNYHIQAASGGDLSWTPTVAGEYIVYMQIDVDSSMDSDLTNNDMTYTVTVQHERDIVVDLCWTDGPNGDCKASPANHDSVQGSGPHNFMLTVTGEGSEDWEPRNTQFSVEFGGAYVTEESGIFLDSSFNDVAANSASMTVTAGETSTVDVWHNVSEPAQTVTDPNDVQANPCANAANPCQQDRTVLVFETTYTYRGVIKGDEATGGESAPSSFSVTAMLTGFDLYAPRVDVHAVNSITMNEQNTDYDDRTGNNDGTLSGYFTVFHDIGVTSLTGGPNQATAGKLNSGLNRFYANVVYGGSSATNYYDWSVNFTITDENGNVVFGPNNGTFDECLTDDEDSYSHTTLSQTNPGSTPEGKACIDVMLSPGRYSITANVDLIRGADGGDTEPSDATDMNSGNDMRGTFFEVINDKPTAYFLPPTLQRWNDDTGWDWAEGPIVAGDRIVLTAAGFDTESLMQDLHFSWSRITADGERQDMCSGSVWAGIGGVHSCTRTVDGSWAGQRMVSVTVTDPDGGATSDSRTVSTWNTYSMFTNITEAAIGYSLVYSPFVAFNVTAVDGASYTQQQLGSNAGAFDSVVSFDMTVTNVFNPTDIGAETMTIDFNGNVSTSWGLWYLRTVDSQWTSVNHVTQSAGNNGGVTLTFNHDGGLEGNLNGGTYAIFDVANAGAEPPATGVTGLTATLQPGAQVVFDWGYVDDSALTSTDTVNLYYCSGMGCDPMAGTAMPAMNPTTTSWTMIGTDGESYTVYVQTENGNTDESSGAVLTGGGMAITVTADGSVSPAPGINADVPSAEGDSLTFTWTATDTGDVSSWMVCWAASQSVVQDSFDSVVGDGACAETTDTTTSLTVTEQDMCGGSCSSNMFFAVGAKDATGNVYSPDGDSHLMTADYSSGVVDPGVIDGESETQPPTDEIEDSDGDGVTDTNDICPQTTIGESVDSDGCSANQIDSDEDGWNDTVDQCPSLWGNSTLRNGCPDSDNDEIIDPDDDCPSLFGTSVQPVVGCPDDDSDGWANANDTFPSNANEWYDADGDLVGDNADQCPNTALDVEVGRDGCELPEESNIVLYSVAGAGGLAGASLLFFLLPRMMRGMNAEEQKERMKWDEAVWQEPQGMPMGPPVQEAKQPEPGLSGVRQADGYEYLEWPAASGDWWYRTGAGLDWSKWEQ